MLFINKAILKIIEKIKSNYEVRRFVLGILNKLKLINLFRKAYYEYKFKVDSDYDRYKQSDLVLENVNNKPICNDKKLIVDVSTIVDMDMHTGVQRVVKSIFKEMVQLRGVAVYAAYLAVNKDKKICYKVANYNMENESFSKTSVEIEFNSNDHLLGLDLAQYLVIKAKSLYEELKCKGVIISFVVYDLLPITDKDYFGDELSEVHEEWLRVIVSHRNIICISKTVLRELNKWLAFNKIKVQKLDSFDLGSDVGQLNNNCFFEEKNKTNKPVFIMVGTIEPRKGHEQILEVFYRLLDLGYDVRLNIIGKYGWGCANVIKKMKGSCYFNKKIFWFDKALDDELTELYNSSDCLIAASYNEGYGLPIVEAARQDLHIIAREIEIFKEICEDGATYFSYQISITRLIEFFQNWIVKFLNNTLTNKGKVKYISWKKSAEQLANKVIEL